MTIGDTHVFNNTLTFSVEFDLSGYILDSQEMATNGLFRDNVLLPQLRNLQMPVPNFGFCIAHEKVTFAISLVVALGIPLLAFIIAIICCLFCKRHAERNFATPLKSAPTTPM